MKKPQWKDYQIHDNEGNLIRLDIFNYALDLEYFIYSHIEKKENYSDLKDSIKEVDLWHKTKKTS